MRDFDEFLNGFLSAVRADPWLADAFIIVAPELNTGLVGGSVTRILRSYERTYGLRTEKDSDIGVRTTKKNKNQYAYFFGDELDRENNLQFLRNFIVAPPPNKDDYKGPRDPVGHRARIAEDFYEQILRAEWEFSDKPVDGPRAYVPWSGKRGGKNDDMIVGAAMLMWVMKVWEKGAFPLVNEDMGVLASAMAA